MQNNDLYLFLGDVITAGYKAGATDPGIGVKRLFSDLNQPDTTGQNTVK